MHVTHLGKILALRHSLAERVSRMVLRVEGAVHLGQDQDLSLARELNVDYVHVIVFAPLRFGAEVLFHPAEEVLARHHHQQDGRDGHGEVAGTFAPVPEVAAEVVEPVRLRGGQADIFGQREKEEMVEVRHGDSVGVHQHDAVKGVVEEEGEELVEAAAVVHALRVVL